MMPYIIILKVRKFHQSTRNHFGTAGKNLGSYSHFYIHVNYLFSIIYFIFTSYRPCSVTLTRDWLISYLALHLNLKFCIYYFIHNTIVTHILSLKNGLLVRNIGFTKYFLTGICCVVILICSFLKYSYL